MAFEPRTSLTTANTAPAASSTSAGLTTSGQPAGANAQPAASSAANASTGLITIDVTPRQAEQIAQGVSLGTFYLTLNAPGLDPSKFTPPAEIVSTWNLFDQNLAAVNELRGSKAK